MIFGLNAVDFIIIALAIVVGYTGWVHGFVVGLLSFAGFVGGAVAGLLLVPVLLGSLEPGLGVSILAALLVLAVASIGQGVLAWTGGWVRSKVSSQPARHVDAAGGAALGIIGLLLAAWALGLALSTAAIPYASQGIRESAILRTVDDAVPVSPDNLRDAFQDVVIAEGFPEVVAPWVPEPIGEVEAPDGNLHRDPDIQKAAESVVHITGRAPECSRVLSGSGFVVAPERVMTNAHVVAGVNEPVVTFADGDPLAARVVDFDSDIDLAVLAVPDLPHEPLDLADGAPGTGVDAVVVGYPGSGPLTATPVRVRGQHELVGRDIYGDGSVTRDVLGLRGEVRPGNSGGPLVSTDGTVYGTIFAASLTDPSTGYALSDTEVRPMAESAADATDPVPTGSCT
ncbi:serine protease [Actinobacteria bacterium YIM 96077]|uniref:Serine protease n=1 Tax=Phytoactinopolyspora halophila TaxID=1981511 RepID=A0A329QZV9_9ACTN|nr:MarP family serine protease [Phytoactinopolyspora halophila]AYY11778.1 serine protease [Actinobacteria bacterium YIM 96077]RAW17787.1 serine protease [Phytoactinopolyspora halophila]